MKTKILPIFAALAAVLLGGGTEMCADCCGGGGGSGAGSAAMPPIGKFAQVRRLRLQVFPAERQQHLLIHNLRTGELLSQTAIGPSTAHAVAFSLSMPVGGESPLGYTVADAVPGSEGKSGFVAEMAPDPASGGEGALCPDDSCGSEASAGSIPGEMNLGADPGTTSEPSANQKCSPAGDGSVTNTDTDAADSSEQGAGSGTTPLSPPRSPIPPANAPAHPSPVISIPRSTSDTFHAPVTLYDEMLANLRKTKGAAHVEISLGQRLPPLRFSKRFLNNEDIGSANFRRYFSTTALRLHQTTRTAVPGEFAPAGVFEVAFEPPSMGLRALYDGNGIRSIETAQHVVNIVNDGSTTQPATRWVVEFTPKTPAPRSVRIVDGHYLVFDETPNVPAVALAPTIKWTFSYDTFEGRRVLRVSSSGTEEKHAHLFWQTMQNGEFHTFLMDAGQHLTSEIVDRDDNYGNLTRGEITTRGTGIGASRSGWIMRTGPANTGQPASTDPQVIEVNFGGEGNTIWKWASNGPWEKTSVTPSMDALTRRIETLRPAPGLANAAQNPQAADLSNSRATVEEISTMKMGEVRTVIESLGGHETSRTLRARGAGNDSSGRVFFTETILRFPDGPQSAPLVSYAQRFSKRGTGPEAGRPKLHLREDGSGTSYTYHSGRASWEQPGPSITLPADVPDGALQIVEESFRVDNSVEATTFHYEDSDQRTLQSWRYVNFGPADLRLTEATRWTYHSASGTVAGRQRRRSFSEDWQTLYSATFNAEGGKLTATETDETGVATVSSGLDVFGNAQYVVRDPVDGIPAQWTKYTYDSAGRMLSRTAMGANWTTPLTPCNARKSATTLRDAWRPGRSTEPSSRNTSTKAGRMGRKR